MRSIAVQQGRAGGAEAALPDHRQAGDVRRQRRRERLREQPAPRPPARLRREAARAGGRHLAPRPRPSSPTWTTRTAQLFLAEMGQTESGLARLIRAAFSLLGLQTYFTAGVKEVRAWTIHVGDTAPQAAGVIHTDFERGFIRAQTIAFADFIAHERRAGREGGRADARRRQGIRRQGWRRAELPVQRLGTGAAVRSCRAPPPPSPAVPCRARQRLAALGCCRWSLTGARLLRRRPARPLGAGDPAGLRVAALSRPPASPWRACWSSAGACSAAVALGALASSVALNALARPRTTRCAVAMPLVVACAAALQAGVGAALVRRFVPRAADADRAARRRRLLRLLRRRAASSAPASSTLALRAGAPRPGGEAARRRWATWWLGDLVGLLDRDADRPDPDRPAALRVGAAPPLGRPDDDAGDAFLGLGIVQAARWNRRAPAQRRSRTTRPSASLIARDASSRSRCARSRRCAACSPSSATCARADMRLAHAALARLRRRQRDGLERARPARRHRRVRGARARRGRAGYRVFDRTDAGARRRPTPPSARRRRDAAT